MIKADTNLESDYKDLVNRIGNIFLRAIALKEDFENKIVHIRLDQANKEAEIKNVINSIENNDN